MKDSLVGIGNRINQDPGKKFDFIQLMAGETVTIKYEFPLSDLFMVEKNETYKLKMEFVGLVKETEASKACETSIKFTEIINTR
jgi:hypothetical protein